MSESVRTATRVRDVSKQNRAFGAAQHLYRVSPPLVSVDGGPSEWVVVSSVTLPFSGLETLVFPSDEHGGITSYSELIGGRGQTAHDVFSAAGYEVIDGVLVVHESPARKAIES